MEKLKELDKKILIGVGITISFLIIYLVTLPYVSYNENPFDSYSGLNETQKSEKNIGDINTFNKAILMQDNTYCNNILNATMKKDCVNTVSEPSSAPVVTQEPQEEKNIDDINNYNKAILTNDKTYCNNIIDEQMKTECSNGIIDTTTNTNTYPSPETSIVIQEPQEEKNIDDINNYNKAILTNDKTYCNNIIDEQMKTECSSR